MDTPKLKKDFGGGKGGNKRPLIPDAVREKMRPPIDLTPGASQGQQEFGTSDSRQPHASLDMTPRNARSASRDEVKTPDLKKNLGEVIAGWVFAANMFFKGKVRFLADKEQVLMGEATDYLEGEGVFIGKDQSDGVYKFRLGDPLGSFFSWDGTSPAGAITPHALTHEDGGSDELDVTGLSGLLDDPQNPTAHATSHENGGGDEIDVTGLSGLLADPQDPTAHTHDTGDITDIAMGTYSPTRSAEANLDANVTFASVKYLRIGSMVHVAGRFTADPTAPGAASFEMTLPVASELGAAGDVSGVAFCGAIAAQGAEIIGVAANDTAKVQWIAGDITSQTWSFHFMYRII